MAAFWYVLVGGLLIAIALLGRFLDRMPVSPAMIYLVVGFLLGPAAFNVLELHPLRELTLLESITEIGLLIALFTVGIKMRVPIGDWRWSVPMRLATISMVVTIAGIAAAAMIILGFDWPLALVIGAVLAPTDPVLASDVQLRSAQDRDSLRFGLTGEGGLNDGTAFPFVLLGLGAMGLHELGWMGWRWIAIDLVWGIAGGLGIGFLVGTALARGVRLLRAWRRDAVIFDEFLLLGVIALSYGVALAAGALGFLAVFAAGLALRRADDIHANAHEGGRQAAADAEHAERQRTARANRRSRHRVVGGRDDFNRLLVGPGTRCWPPCCLSSSAHWPCGSAFAKQARATRRDGCWRGLAFAASVRSTTRCISPASSCAMSSPRICCPRCSR